LSVVEILRNRDENSVKLSHQRRVSTRTNWAFTLLIILPALLCLAPLSKQGALAQEVPVLHQFIGGWEGHGKLFGADAAFSMQWEWVLEQQFVRLTFQNKMQSGDGTVRILKAQAFYKPIGAGQFEGTWFDSRGMVLPLQGSAADTTLTTLWGTPEIEQGRTVYRLLGEGQLEVEDFVLRGDQWQQFGHALYRRMDTSKPQGEAVSGR
jgi:hypothetical protein